MALKITPNTKAALKNTSVYCQPAGKKLAMNETKAEHITPAIKHETYPTSKQELQARLENVEKQIKQNPDDINLRKYYEALKNITD